MGRGVGDTAVSRCKGTWGAYRAVRHRRYVDSAKEEMSVREEPSWTMRTPMLRLLQLDGRNTAQ